MAAYSVTYDRLLTIAARAAGLDRASLSGDELALLADVPNVAQARVARARRWPSIVSDLSLSVAPGDLNVLLPADFECIEQEDSLNHAGGTGYPPLIVTTLGHIQALRAQGTTSGPPTHVAVGPADATGSNKQRLRLHLWPTPEAARTLVGTYRRAPQSMSGTNDVPDLPLALFDALQLCTRIVAREEFAGQSSGEDEALYQQRIAEAAHLLLAPVANGAPLVTLRRRLGLPRGENRELDMSSVPL